MNIILVIIKLIWNNLSSTMREAVVKFVKELEEKAKESANEWDDVAVQILKTLLGIS